MGVHRHSDGRWYIDYKIEGRKKREYFGRGIQAEAAARDRFIRLEVRPYGKLRSDEGPTFYEVVQAYLDDKLPSIAESTALGLLPKIKSIYLPDLGHLLASQITEARIQAYIKKRLKSVKKTTIHRELCDIRAILNWAVQKKLLLANPMADATWPRRDDERIRPPSIDEVRRILEHSPQHLYRAVVLAWYCGMRVGGELFSRKWHDIDWGAKLVYVVSAQKGGLDTRRVPIAPELLPELRQWYQVDSGDDSPVDDLYIIRWRGKRVVKIKTAWSRALKKAGITRRLRPYDLRHSFVTGLTDAGADPHTVGKLVGHKDESTTMYVYNHISDERNRAIIKKRKGIL